MGNQSCYHIHVNCYLYYYTCTHLRTHMLPPFPFPHKFIIFYTILLHPLLLYAILHPLLFHTIHSSFTIILYHPFFIHYYSIPSILPISGASGKTAVATLAFQFTSFATSVASSLQLYYMCIIYMYVVNWK